MARMASQSIQHSYDALFDELGIFQEKLLRHSRRKDCEREFISESRNAMNDFQHTLERVRQNARVTASSGRETPDSLDQVEHQLEEAWGDFDTVRGTMLNNLNLLNEAKEELMRERLRREEESDDDQLLMLENMIQDIRQTQQHKAEHELDSIRDSKSYGHSERSPYVQTDRPKYGTSGNGRDRLNGYTPRGSSRYSARDPSGYSTRGNLRKNAEYVPSDRHGYSMSSNSRKPQS